MRQRSNVRCFLPKSEAIKLLVVFQQIAAWQDKTDGYDPTDDVSKSFDEAYRVIRERMRNGGPGWTPKP